MKKWDVNYELDQAGDCCGIGILSNVMPDDVTNVNDYYYDNASGTYQSRKREGRFATWRAAVRHMTSKAKHRGFMRTLVMIPRSTKKWKELYDLFVAAGWKDLGPSRTRMNPSRYNIHLLEIHRPLRKRKAKTHAV